MIPWTRAILKYQMKWYTSISHHWYSWLRMSHTSWPQYSSMLIFLVTNTTHLSRRAVNYQWLFKTKDISTKVIRFDVQHMSYLKHNWSLHRMEVGIPIQKYIHEMITTGKYQSSLQMAQTVRGDIWKVDQCIQQISDNTSGNIYEHRWICSWYTSYNISIYFSQIWRQEIITGYGTSLPLTINSIIQLLMFSLPTDSTNPLGASIT